MRDFIGKSRSAAQGCAALLLLCLAGHAAAQSIYRCQDAEGKVVLQQTACAPGRGEAVKVAPGNVVDSRPAGEEGLRQTIERRRVGGSGLQQQMTDAEVLQQLGQPTTVNTDIVNGQVSRQYVYRYADGSTRYVYTRDGGLYAVQNRPAVNPVRQKRCHSDLEIRNAEVGIGSVNLPPEERARRSARAEAMRSCRE